MFGSPTELAPRFGLDARLKVEGASEPYLPLQRYKDRSMFGLVVTEARQYAAVAATTRQGNERVFSKWLYVHSCSVVAAKTVRRATWPPDLHERSDFEPKRRTIFPMPP